MKLVVFGLSVSSSWGNGHATLWRGLIAGLARRGVRVVFFEKDEPWYAGARDLTEIPGGELVLYRDFAEIRGLARRHLAEAEAAMVTSYCPDGIAAAALVADAPGLRLFYDLDTPVTLARLSEGGSVPYIGPEGLAPFDLVLSYTGGRALDELRDRLGARATAPLYGHADPAVHRPAAADPAFSGDLSYLGTYAEDRQTALEALFVEPARRAPEKRFVIGGAQYPPDFPWTRNIAFVRHLPPEQHAAFYAASPLTLNVTRKAMADSGWCPSGRLFEAALCGTALLSDWWEGLDAFFAPDAEILIARDAEDTLAALDRSPAEIARIAEAARERALRDHTSDRRAEDLLRLMSTAKSAGAGGSPSSAPDGAPSPAREEGHVIVAPPRHIREEA
jgi:spore maturation protein CgeB